MKILVNGDLNLSELDGWWAEAYRPEVGLVLGDDQEHGDDPAWDAIDAKRFYDLLEQEVIPEFYARNEHGAFDPAILHQPLGMRIYGEPEELTKLLENGNKNFD